MTTQRIAHINTSSLLWYKASFSYQQTESTVYMYGVNLHPTETTVKISLTQASGVYPDFYKKGVKMKLRFLNVTYSV